MSPILDEALLVAARERYLGEMRREVKLFARRAEGPVDRAALAELEQEIENVEHRWKKAGMLNGTEQLEFAGAPAGGNGR